jgi:hypothetical protein
MNELLSSNLKVINNQIGSNPDNKHLSNITKTLEKMTNVLTSLATNNNIDNKSINQSLNYDHINDTDFINMSKEFI